MSIESSRAREQAATPGPWEADTAEPDDVVVWSAPDPRWVANVGNWARHYPEVAAADQLRQAIEAAAADAAFIAHARQDIPALLRVAEAAARDMENCAGCKADERGYCYRHNETGPTLRDLDALP